MSLRRAAALAALLAAAAPALAYVLPATAILRQLGQRRAALQLSTLEVTATLRAEGAAAARLAPLVGAPAAPALEVPVRLQLAVPHRCRLELAPADAAVTERPALATRDAQLAARGALETVPGAAALVRSVCLLLAQPAQGDASEIYGAALARRGVALPDVTLGRFDGRIAYVIGGRDRDAKPLLFVSKDDFQPMRLLATEGGALTDVRLLGWGSATGGDWFPRAVEVREGGALLLRLTTERAAANVKLDAAL